MEACGAGRKRSAREGVAAEEKRGVEGVAGEGVPEKGDAGQVTGCESGERARIETADRPNGEISDDEKLNGAEERGESDAGDGAAITQPEADGNVDEETGVDDGD